MRNSDWTLDETVLLMDLYLDAPRAGKTHPQVVALSALLRAAALRDGRTVSATFRNPAGIAMRLRNFGKHDPSALAGRDAGLRPGGAVDREAWRQFGGDRAVVAREAMRIRRSIAAVDGMSAASGTRGPELGRDVFDGARTTEGVNAVRGVIDGASPALAAFDYLMAHAGAAGFRPVPRLTGTVRSVELQRADRRENPFSAQTHRNHLNFYMRRPALSAVSGLFEAAVAEFGEVRPNALGEYRTHVRDVAEAERLLDFLRAKGAWPSRRHDRRFAASVFEAVTGEHLLRAALRLADGFDNHPFGESTTYDLLFEGLRLPPKAVFGLAASEALGFPVGPDAFRGGEDTQTFRILRANGYPVVAKGEVPTMASPEDEERLWSEGRPRLVTHLRRERATGLAAAKRARFRAEHGRLFCERCRMDPVATFGSAVGEACIEVHHRDVHLADMRDGHGTGLDELECLCANCHRVTHRELKDRFDTSG